MAINYGALASNRPPAPVPRRFKGTRNSVIPDVFKPPYEVVLNFMKHDDGLVHSTGWCRGASAYITCCGVRFGPTLVVHPAPSCMKCALCTGCAACIEGYVREETMRLGKWVTRDDRELYPFEMDTQHLINSIKKLIRDEDRHKKNWKEWLEVLGAEARLRRLAL